MTAAEMEQFVEECPEIACFWQEPDTLQSLWLPKEDSILYESWDQVAKRMVSHLWRMSSAKIFHEPVDAEKMGAADYNEIVKHPIDLGSIKQRLITNHYHAAQEFIDDILLLFDNCLLYNGETSKVGIMCNKVRNEFKKLYEELNMEFYLR